MSPSRSSSSSSSSRSKKSVEQQQNEEDPKEDEVPPTPPEVVPEPPVEEVVQPSEKVSSSSSSSSKSSHRSEVMMPPSEIPPSADEREVPPEEVPDPPPPPPPPAASLPPTPSVAATEPPAEVEPTQPPPEPSLPPTPKEVVAEEPPAVKSVTSSSSSSSSSHKSQKEAEPAPEVKEEPPPPIEEAATPAEEEPTPTEEEASESSEGGEGTKAVPFPTTLDGIIKSRETGGRCQDCTHAPAEVRCDDCNLTLCKECDTVIHSRNAFSHHKPISLTPSPGSFPRSVCNFCKSRPSIAMCLSCDTNSTMCAPCWFQRHKDRHRSLHKPKLLLWPCDNCFIEQQLKGQGRAPPALWFCPSCSLRLCRACWRDVHGVDGDRQFHSPTDIYTKDNNPISLQPGRREATQLHYSNLASPLARSDLSVDRTTQKLHRLGFDPVVRYRLLNYITLMCPHKLPSVVPTLRLFSGRTNELFARLCSRYGPEPTYDCLRLPLPHGWRLVQSAYGDVFYLHTSGRKQWERPGLHNASEAANLLVTVGHHGLLHNELK